MNSLRQKISSFELIDKEELSSLANGDDTIAIDFTLKSGKWGDEKYSQHSIELSWNQICKTLFPKINGIIKETSFKIYLSGVILEYHLGSITHIGYNKPSIAISSGLSNTIKIQFLALGCLNRYEEKVETEKGIKIVKTLSLTNKGEKFMFQLNAIKK